MRIGLLYIRDAEKKSANKQTINHFLLPWNEINYNTYQKRSVVSSGIYIFNIKPWMNGF